LGWGIERFFLIVDGKIPGYVIADSPTPHKVKLFNWEAIKLRNLYLFVLYTHKKPFKIIIYVDNYVWIVYKRHIF